MSTKESGGFSFIKKDLPKLDLFMEEANIISAHISEHESSPFTVIIFAKKSEIESKWYTLQPVLDTPGNVKVMGLPLA